MSPASQPSCSPFCCSHAVDRGDLLRLLELGIARAEAARLCGFALLDEEGEHKGPSSHFASTQRTPPPVANKAPTSAPHAAPPLWRAIGPDLRQPDPAERRQPACLARDVPPLSGEDLKAKNPTIVPPKLLASWARLGSTLRRMLTVERPGPGLDAPKLVRLLASLRPIARLPRSLRRAWTPRLQVYWDQSQALGPCLEDQRAALAWLQRWRGETGLECIVLPDNGAAEWYPKRGTGQPPSEARRPNSPDAGTTILALSDLGFADGDRERQDFWVDLHGQAVRAGAACHALVLAPRARWGRALAQAWKAHAWDRMPGGCDSAQALDELFLLLSPAVRVEVGLLREVRRLVCNGAADLGVELDAWRDARVLARNSALGIVLDAPRMHGLQGHFRELPEGRRNRVVKLLEHFHDKLSPTILAEEKLAAGKTDAGVWNPIISQAKWLVDHDSQYGDLTAAMRGYVERLVWRLPPEAWQQHPELRALWAAAHRTGNRFAKPLPDGIEPQDVLWALETISEPRWWLLFQRGTALRLMPAEGLPVTSSLGSLVAHIRARLPRLEVLWRPAGGRARKAILEPGVDFVLPFSSESQDVSRVEVVGDLGKAEIVLDSHPPWAERFWRDKDGLWVETTVRGFEWKVEEKRSRIGGKRLTIDIVPRDLKTRLLWPTWATRLSKDPHGLVAELDLTEEPERTSRVVTRLRWIPPGRFLMGSLIDGVAPGDDERPHWVRLTQGFWLADAPCTQAEWRAVMKTEPSQSRGDALPVEHVSWEDCLQFCEQLRQRFPGLSAMLPSEAQWEYACRAGTATAFNSGSPCTRPEGKDPALTKIGWFDRNSGRETRPVRGLERNRWGLYDMHGNVWEWCQDWFGPYEWGNQKDPHRVAEGLERVSRGGSCLNHAANCRSACRFSMPPGSRTSSLGFRLASGQSGQPSHDAEERSAGKPTRRMPAALSGERAKKARRR